MAQGRRRTRTIPCAPVTITRKGTPTRSTKTLKISYAVESVVQISEEGAAFLLRNYKRNRDGLVPQEAAPEGFKSAIAKLPNDASDEQILRTIVGEVTSLIIADEVPAFYPREYMGFRARISKVAYQETPEKLDPPSDAIPLVVHVGDRNVH